MSEPIPVKIGGVTYLLPPMPFYCLERAWPHIQNMADVKGDFMAQTREALAIIVAALSLDPNPPTVDDLAKRMLGSEMTAMHAACTELLEVSGLTPKEGDDAGEATAAGQQPVLLNGSASSLS